MSTTSEQTAQLSIRLLKCDCHIQTWNNILSDVGDQTLISPDSPVFQKVSDLSVGDLVQFSGRFVSGNDYIGEQSITEGGAMTYPEFTFIFQDVAKLNK